MLGMRRGGDGGQAKTSKESLGLSTKPLLIYYHLRGGGAARRFGSDLEWSLIDAKHQATLPNSAGKPPPSSGLFRAASIISSEQPARWHDRHNLPGSHAWEQPHQHFSAGWPHLASVLGHFPVIDGPF